VNGQTLYFSTDSRLGFGGFDIYFSELEKSGNWQEPINFGYPINTHEDELAMFISSDGSTGYYSHKAKLNGSTSSKLYKIDIPDDIRIKYRSSFVSGIIYDSLTSKPLAARVELYNLSTSLATNQVDSDSLSGKYLMVLTEGAEYALYVDADNYFFKSYHFNLESDSLGMQGVLVNIALSPIKNGEKTTLNNVLFEYDSYALTEKSKKALKYVVNYLKNHPSLNIEIAGHTDNIGGENYNLDLSNNRAASVYAYLVANGVDALGLTYNGYGSSLPIASNEIDCGRAKNRRIELKILK
jgi:outer membrane protein OmpA-like peptidoglycan-associated protein